MQQANVNLPTGTLQGRAAGLHDPGRRASCTTRRTTGRLIVAYRNGAPVRLEELGAGDRQRARTTRSPPGTTTSARVHRAGDPAPAGHEHGGGGRRRCKALLASVSEQTARLGVDSTCSTTARESIKESVDDVKFTLVLTLVPGRAGDLPLPAQHLGDGDPQPGAADVDRRHVRRDVPAGLHARQPVADGADAVGGLRRRRRDRDAREHRPPHGDGREPVRRRRWKARARSASRSSR